MSVIKFQSTADFLKAKRIAANISQTDMAKKLGYKTSQFISNWERGISQPPIKTISTLANLYSVDPNEMFEIIRDDAVKNYSVEMMVQYELANGTPNA